MEQFKQIKEIIESMETDAVKFYEKGNMSARLRYRNQLKELSKLAIKERRDVLLA